MDSKNLIITNKGNFYDLMNMTMQVCAAMKRHEKDLSAGEIQLVDSLTRLIRLEVNYYSSVGLSNEREYWGALQEIARKQIPE